MRNDFDRRSHHYNFQRRDPLTAVQRSDSAPEENNRRFVDEHRRNWWQRAGDEMLSWLGDDYAERRRRHDEISHRGKGPKNYRRSDERIREDINDKLTDEWNIDATDIEVSVFEGEVILTGFVSDLYQKRCAAHVAEVVTGVRHVENRIRVESETPKDNIELMP